MWLVVVVVAYVPARPTTAACNVFITVTAPFTGLATTSVTVLVGRACARTGVSRFGPHGLRHAAACDLLAAGASLEEIGQRLRHAQQRTTATHRQLFCRGTRTPASRRWDLSPKESPMRLP